MRQPLISIVGTTATGKTAVALELAQAAIAAKKYARVHLISADSRQVYSELAILSGADVPDDFTAASDPNFSFPFFQNQEKTIILHGVSMLAATDEWSVALFREFALKILRTALGANELVIIVGGTGLYHAHLMQLDPALMIPPDPIWRAEALTLSIESLHEVLKALDAKKLENLNHSDKNNPRRLQRAIEVARTTPIALPEWQVTTIASYTQQYFGLSISREALAERIQLRVQKRLEQKVLSEVTAYFLTYGELDLPSASTLGLKELWAYQQGEISREVALEKWTTAEVQYARRQAVWWKKQPGMHWLDSTLAAAQILESITE